MLERSFDELGALLAEWKFHTDLISNMDETMVSVDLQTRKRTLVPKGCKVGVARGSSSCLHITALVCGFATGDLRMNPLIIVPQKEIPGDLPDDVIATNDWATNSTGWINADILLDWAAKTYIPAVNGRRLLLGLTMETGPALLIVDNHSSRDERFNHLMAENNVVVFYLVPHSSHLTQPLDVHTFSVLKNKLRGLTCKFNNGTVADR
jgi:hypothetical protein